MTEYLTPGYKREFGEQFTAAKREEIRGLRDKDIFKVVKKESVLNDANILGDRFVLCIKYNGIPQERHKARLVVEGLRDKDKHWLEHSV